MRKHNDHPRERVDNLDAVLRTDLARLYAPMEGPNEVDNRFELALQKRHGQQQDKVTNPSFSSHSTPFRLFTGLGLATILVAVAVATLVSGRSTTGVAEAQAFLQQIPDRLAVEPGQVLHTRTEVFERYGPKAGVIADATGIGTENHIRESWIEFGDGDLIASSLGRLIDDNGVTVQKSSFDGSRRYEINPKTGQVLRDEAAAAPRVNIPKARAEAFAKALTDGTSKVVSQTDSELTIETRQDVPAGLAAPKDNPNDYDVPYIADLGPQTFITRETIGQDGVVRAHDVFVITQTGQVVLILSERTTVNEVLEDLPDQNQLN